MAVRSRTFVLPISAVLIASLCAYKLTRSGETPSAANQPAMVRTAPLWELYDQQKPPRLVRLNSFLGRHQIVLVFFDVERGFEADPVLPWLRRNAAALKRDGVKVLAVSPALPQVHRRMLADWLAEDEALPFTVLSDIFLYAYQRYGLPTASSQPPPTGVFLIDRAGHVAWEDDHPQPLRDPLAALKTEFSLD